MAHTHSTFQKILDGSVEFSQAKDIDVMLERVLSAARRLAHAETGIMYLDEDGTLRRHHAQHSDNPGSAEETRAYQQQREAVDERSLAAHIARTGEIVNIPDCRQMPENPPYTVSWPRSTEDRPYGLIAFPIKNAKRKVLGVIELFDPHDDSGHSVALSDDDLPLVRLFAANAAAAIERAQATRARIMGILQVLTTLRNTEETLGHFHRVGAYAAEIYRAWARKHGIDAAAMNAQADILRTAAMLHDIGKLAIPNIIRSKPGRLTDDEYATMQQHTVKGAQLLRKYAQSDLERVAAEIALTHHERWDGTGYPGHVDIDTGQPLPGYEKPDGTARGKHGEEIPVFGRVVAVADVYDALLSDRVYRAAWEESDVLAELRKGAGSLFDPAMIDAFFENLDVLHAVAQRYADE